MKIPTTPVIIASLTFATSSLAAPTSKKPDCGSPSIGERSPLIGGGDSWEPALSLKGKGVGGQGRPWGNRKRDEDPNVTSSPSLAPTPAPSASGPALNAESIPLLDNAIPGLGLTSAKGPLVPVTGLVGSAPGVVKGVLGSATGTLSGLLGGTPVGGLVGSVGNIGTGLAGGLVDSVGGVVGGAGGGLGLGQILKPVTGTVGGLLNGLPIVGPIAGPIAGGLTDTLGGLSLAQGQGQGQVGLLNAPSDPAQAQYPVPGMGTPSTGLPGLPAGVPSNGLPGSMLMAQAQAVQEQVVGNLGGGSFLTNTGRIVSLLPAGAGSAVPAGLANGATSGLPGQLSGLTGDGGPLAGLTGNGGPLAGLTGNGGPLAGLPVQVPSGLPGLDGLGQAIRPVTSNPLAQAPLTNTPLGQGQSPLDLGQLAGIVSNLPPGLSQIVQPVGSAEKFLQIGNQLIPLGAIDPTRLAQLGLNKLPISTVNGIPGVASINYLQDQDQGTEGESKEVKANPVTTWMNQGDAAAAGNSTMPATTTPVDSTDPTPTAGTGDAGAEPSASASGAPQIAQFNVQPLYVAPTPSSAVGQLPPKGYTQWSEVNLNEGETFDRIADGMSGREKNYYNGAEKNSTTVLELPSATPSGTPLNKPTATPSGQPGLDEGPAPDFHANKGRVGWQLVDVANEPSSTSGWHHVASSATATATASSSSSAVRTGPTAAPANDAGTYAWSEDWGDWVSAGMDDMGLNVGWDDMSPYEDPTGSQGQGQGGSQMYTQPSAGLS